MRERTSASQACGSISFITMTAARSPSRSEPQNNQRTARSAALLDRQMRPSSGKRGRARWSGLKSLVDSRKAQGKKPAVISPLALEAVRRIDALFEIERAINGQSPERRRAVRQELSAPLVANAEAWMREQRARLSRGNDIAKAMDYMSMAKKF